MKLSRSTLIAAQKQHRHHKKSNEQKITTSRASKSANQSQYMHIRLRKKSDVKMREVVEVWLR